MRTIGLLACISIAQVASLEAVEVPMYSIEQRNMFFGKLYMGSQFTETSVIFDTMAQVIAVTLKRCEGASMPSKYDFASTDTEEPIVVQKFDEWEPLTGLIRYNSGQTLMQGAYYTDQMCLVQPTE